MVPFVVEAVSLFPNFHDHTIGPVVVVSVRFVKWLMLFIQEVSMLH